MIHNSGLRIAWKGPCAFPLETHLQRLESVTLVQMIKNVLLRLVRLLERLTSRMPQISSFQPVRGYFSAFELLEKNCLTGALLMARQQPGPCPPASITARSGMNQHNHQPWPVFWVKSQDARLVGRMLHWRDTENRLCAEGVFHMHERRRLGEDSPFAQIFVPKPLELPGAWTSIASNWGDGRNYYHWMTDNLTRLMIRELLPEPTRILIPRGTHGFIRETLEMLGLTEIAETPDAHCLRPERFYFCSPVSMSGVWNPCGFNWLRKRFAPHLADEAIGAPVFLTRKGGTRIPENIAAIEKQFSDHGFRIVDCAKLSVKEQLAMASSAPAVAGLHGAAMTNLLWARPGTPVLELFQSGYLNACYEQIAFQGKLGYHAVVLDEAGSHQIICQWLESRNNPLAIPPSLRNTQKVALP